MITGHLHLLLQQNVACGQKTCKGRMEDGLIESLRQTANCGLFVGLTDSKRASWVRSVPEGLRHPCVALRLSELKTASQELKVKGCSTDSFLAAGDRVSDSVLDRPAVNNE